MDSWGLLRVFLILRLKTGGKVNTAHFVEVDAWVRTDAFLHETNDFDEIDPEQVARTLKTFKKSCSI